MAASYAEQIAPPLEALGPHGESVPEARKRI
jgi:hypothetical protein